MPNQPPDFTIDFANDNEQTVSDDIGYSVVSEVQDPFPVTFQQPSTGVYEEAGLTVQYQRHKGLAWAPLAAPEGTQVVFWRTHSGYCIKIVSWVLSMLGGDPPLPSPVTGDNEVLIMRDETLGNPTFGPSGIKTFTKAGIFVYVLQKTPADTDIIYGAVNPLDVSGITSNTIDPAKYVSNLIGQVPAPSGFTGTAIRF